MSSAQHSVMVTPELVELVLLHLPMRDLLITAPLVCKWWRDLTLKPTLQRALFFEPDNLSLPRIKNPLLAELFPPFFGSLIDHTASRWSWPGSAKTIMAMPCSLAPEAFKRKEASWRRMLVSQPPARTMAVSERRHARGGNSQRRAVLEDLSPLRMGPLYDLTVSLVDRVAASFRISWRGIDSLYEQAPDNDEDVTLDVMYTVQCRRVQRNRQIDSKFDCDGREQISVHWGETVRI
ncbi:putative f-box domain protein [Favolaschia claudopus]|uniref:F-box domain protein n=1 Tax=Favolaschia claudopus TaxID=2862362 RepID=A0AAW0CJI3_9AGAR